MRWLMTLLLAGAMGCNDNYEPSGSSYDSLVVPAVPVSEPTVHEPQPVIEPLDDLLDEVDALRDFGASDDDIMRRLARSWYRYSESPDSVQAHSLDEAARQYWLSLGQPSDYLSVLDSIVRGGINNG